ncbi:uncharacterized protein [Zea mays]|uniref:Myb/SANT-like DNA-binding domain-containing protein n=2 Tax=Zea mays TaxID=4577 RepID=C0P505_MAIZE|nr:uncharacterized protein LOC100382163 [Zea mays]XP_008677548.1 uncharacterized protein LOC100382163 isoform X1 [Zea mays]ACN28071.1 unknown [Zea mays]AQK52930.1 hypothetical protein ZEAMMB73_Zm00001d050698 [Zea mays]|eukprot:NP_001168394.1 uncharacterized protein LOC100382163 [Zea mays]
MEGNLPPQTMVPGGGPFDLGQPFHFAVQPQALQVYQDVFAAPAASQMPELGNVVKASLSDEEEGGDGHLDRGKAAAASQWHRVKWTSGMVKLLVSAVSYIDEDVDADHGTSSGRRKHAVLKRMGKWKLVSSAMTERGFAVSPQQCEDKFNDLNKRYKRLTEILGRGRACQIVEKPELLEQLSLSGKLREEAKKHLNSKHLHYEEMCSYHNRNRYCLLDDPVLQRSLRMALRAPAEQGKQCLFGYDDEDDQMLLSDDDDDYEDDELNDDLEAGAEDHGPHRVHATEKLKHDHEGHCGSHLSEVAAIDMNRMNFEGSGGPSSEKNLSYMRVQIERQRLKIKSQMLRIEQRHFKWLKFSKEKDRELQKMKLENERMALENERLELELKLKEIEIGIKPKRI